MQTIKYTKNTIFILLFSLLLSSCEEVIDIDLNSSNPAMVADGKIYKDSVAYVRLSLTADYFDDEQPQIIEDATVTLTTSEGDSEVLNYYNDGIYAGIKLRGVSNVNYIISVSNEDMQYTAETKLIAPVDIYEVAFAENEFKPPHSTGEEEIIDYVLTMKFSDDPTMDNYYMIKYWNNEEKVNNYSLTTDRFAENDTIERSTFIHTFVEGTYKVEISSIDEKTYDYYNQLRDLDGGGMGGSTPYNPKSNFGSEVMGYFAAFSFGTMEGDVLSSVQDKE